MGNVGRMDKAHSKPTTYRTKEKCPKMAENLHSQSGLMALLHAEWKGRAMKSG